MELILLLIIPVFLWVFSLVLLSIWTHFLRFIIWNIILILFYFCTEIYLGNYIWGHDPYGIGTFFRLAFCLITHTVIGFLFALYRNYKLRNNETST
ncbi:MAG: Uncharacterised protein [Polaribacter sp. SA4-10]|nr:MAG: Uncharacterised protein [Polaribacter sp. SA4-10]